MYKRRITALAGGITGALLMGAGIAEAQDNSGGTVDLGDSIASTVNDAVSKNDAVSVSGGSGGTIVGSTRTEHNEISLGEQEGLAISDASGGNNNVSFVS